MDDFVLGGVEVKSILFGPAIIALQNSNGAKPPRLKQGVGDRPLCPPGIVAQDLYTCSQYKHTCAVNIDALIQIQDRPKLGAIRLPARVTDINLFTR